METKVEMDEKAAQTYLRAFWDAHPQRTVAYKGKEWKYVVSGEGEKAVMLLHGGGFDAGMWAYQINELEKSYRVIALSFGLIPEPFRLRAEVLNHILENEGIGRCTLCGHSYGGILAQYFLSLYPDKVDKIVLVHTFYPSASFASRIRNKKLRIIRWIPGFIIRKAFQGRMKDVPESGWNAYRKEYLKAIYSGADRKKLVDFYSTFLASLRKELPDISRWKGVVLLINSRDDTDTIDRFQELINTYPGAKTHLFEKGGHHVPLLFPVEFTGVLKAFI